MNFAMVQHELSFRKIRCFLALLKIHIAATMIIHTPTMNNLVATNERKSQIKQHSLFFL
jgi:hypothetical protein